MSRRVARTGSGSTQFTFDVHEEVLEEHSNSLSAVDHAPSVTGEQGFNRLNALTIACTL